MKKIIWILFVILFLLIASCGQKTVYVCADGKEVGSAADCNAIIQALVEIEETATDEESERMNAQDIVVEETEAEQADYTLSAEERALLEERFTASTRAVLSTPLVKNLNPGDLYVAGLAIRNMLGSPHDFVVTLKFREAKDYSGSIVPTDDVLVQAWLGKNLYTPYTLDRSEEVILPLIIEVGDILTEKGDPVVPGTYIYDVYIDYVTNSEATDEYEKLLLTVQVAE